MSPDQTAPCSQYNQLLVASKVQRQFYRCDASNIAIHLITHICSAIKDFVHFEVNADYEKQ